MNPISPANPEQVIKRLGLQVANLVIENSTLHAMIQELQEKIKDMEAKLAKRRDKDVQITTGHD